ncbi:permease-like cell division protein FtsX [uncultured Muribaculum sp.]|uniref:cell division protein FtsX n=1 Tax=uncultured Muribaculum sp. TaxID=1918613 RepID=UPI00259C6961|nr:permease-like cell division protein FtsX [uncultured Muribaculum sp.]
MEKRPNKGISTFSAQITATISVALVLLLIGIIAMLGIAAHSITRNIKENIGFDIVLTDTATDAEVNQLKSKWTASPYTASVRYYSKEDALMNWEEETGENLMDVLGINPFSGELEVKVKADYASSDSINKIITPLKSLPYVHEVNVHTELVDSINRNINSVSLILIIITCALLFISFALINNTVRLTVYSRRFIIHTMKLVGATGSFIRRPFINANVVSGIISALIASAILAGTLYYLQGIDSGIASAITWPQAACVFAGILIIGIIICAVAALFATNKYLRLDYDDMFR